MSSSFISKIGNYTTSTRTNPSVLFELLFGSQQAVNKSVTVESLNKKLSEDFRKQIEANLPVFYLLDAEEIVNGVLEDALHPQLNANKKRGLSRFLVDMHSNDFSFFEYYGDAFLSFDTSYYTEITNKGQVIEGFEASYIQAYNYLVSIKQQIISDVHKAIKNNLKNSVKIADVANDLSEVVAYINSTVADFVDVNMSAASIQKAASVVSASAAGRVMREAFKKYPKTKIDDPEKLINGFNSNTMVLAVAANYELATTDNHNVATQTIKKYLKNIPIKLSTDTGEQVVKVDLNPTAEFLVGNLVAAGHAAVKSKNKGIIGINTPGLQLALAILQANDKPIPGIVKAFIGETGHEAYAIEISTDYEDFAGSLISMQASLLRSQRSSINSGVISGQEISFLDKVFQEALGKSFVDIRKEFVKRVSSGTVGKFFVEKFAQSPTLIQSIENKLVAELIGDSSYIGIRKTTTAKKPVGKSRVIPAVQPKSSSKISPKPSKNKASPVRSPVIENRLNTSVLNLESLLNANLVEQVKQNMGSGNRRDILNLRSGRFAESVKVERLSESRAGMITVFYSYMKNPYATFSAGGRQSSPSSRDPKLLIARSIREIAQTQVANRLRSVSV